VLDYEQICNERQELFGDADHLAHEGARAYSALIRQDLQCMLSMETAAPFDCGSTPYSSTINHTWPYQRSTVAKFTYVLGISGLYSGLGYDYE